jgi:hypothetical protein
MFLLGFKILLNYPTWLILLCLAAGVGYAAILYYRNRNDGFGRSLTWLMASLRFLAVFFIAMLLLGPLMERLNRFVEEPLLIFVQDNSQSIADAAGRSFDLEAYLSEKERFLEKASGHFDVRHYSFGESFSPAGDFRFEERLTDMSDVFSSVESFYSNRNIGAVILASDGIYNRGLNPVNQTMALTFPVYTIAMGDTVPRRDLVVTRLRHNRFTYLGNVFPVEVFVEARQAAGLSSRLSVSRDGTILDSKVITFSSDHHQQTLLFELEADEPGMQRYLVSMEAVEEEISLENNSQSFYIEVIDGRQKVLLLSNAPHPDLGALKLALESQDNYEVTSSLAGDFDGAPEAYNLVILHQLPSASHRIRSVIDRLEAEQIPVLFIIGGQTDLDAYNNLQTGLAVLPRSTDLVEALPSLHNNFALFSLSESAMTTISSLPPLFSPFAQYEQAGGLSVLLYQRIGQVTTGQPLLAFSDSGSRKVATIAGEGLWRWRLHAYLRDSSHAAFDELISRMVQYLSVQEDKSLFRLSMPRLLYENDPVIMEAELYNRSYELVNEPEIQLTILNEDGVAFPYVMARTTNAYQLDAGSFPPGEYTYVAVTTLGAESFREEGRFSVSPLNQESLRTIADHNLLYQMAMNSDGMLVFPGEWDALEEHLLNRTDIRPVMYTRRTLDELINMKALFFVLLMLLSLEWFARKRSGSY